MSDLSPSDFSRKAVPLHSFYGPQPVRIGGGVSHEVDLPLPDSLKDWPGEITTELILAATVVEQSEKIRNLEQRLEAFENGQR